MGHKLDEMKCNLKIQSRLGCFLTTKSFIFETETNTLNFERKQKQKQKKFILKLSTFEKYCCSFDLN